MAEKKSIELRHNDAAEAWALGSERAIVFTVTKVNPERAEFDAADKLEGSIAPPAELRVDYTMPARPNAGLALAYLKRARANADLAMSWLIEIAIGDEGYDALTDELSDSDDVEAAVAIMQEVVATIQRVAMGGLEAPKA